MGRHKRSFTIESELYKWILIQAEAKGILPSAQVSEMLSQAKQLIIDKEHIWNGYVAEQAIREGIEKERKEATNLSKNAIQYVKLKKKKLPTPK